MSKGLRTQSQFDQTLAAWSKNTQVPVHQLVELRDVFFRHKSLKRGLRGGQVVRKDVRSAHNLKVLMNQHWYSAAWVNDIKVFEFLSISEYFLISDVFDVLMVFEDFHFN